MRVPATALMVLSAWMAGVVAAAAGPVYFRLSGGAQRSDPCLARTYDSEHLARNPRQRVTRFHLIRERVPVPDQNNAERFTVRIGFRLRNDSDSYSVNGICTTHGEVAECMGEGDAGEFRLELRGDAVRVQVTRLEVEGSRGSSPNLADSDDRVFLLQPSQRSACPAG
jgi:hypothetical protein